MNKKLFLGVCASVAAVVAAGAVGGFHLADSVKAEGAIGCGYTIDFGTTSVSSPKVRLTATKDVIAFSGATLTGFAATQTLVCDSLGNGTSTKIAGGSTTGVSTGTMLTFGESGAAVANVKFTVTSYTFSSIGILVKANGSAGIQVAVTDAAVTQTTYAGYTAVTNSDYQVVYASFSSPTSSFFISSNQPTTGKDSRFFLEKIAFRTVTAIE